MPLKTVFEKEVCGRCGGSGQYSYNQIDGSRCYGCGGFGERRTKRGRAAFEFYRDQARVAIRDVKVGDRVWLDVWLGSSSKLVAVTISEIRHETNRGKGWWTVDGVYALRSWESEDLRIGGLWKRKAGRDELVYTIPVPRDSPPFDPADKAMRHLTVERVITKAEQAEHLELAKAYQSRLTKAGTLRKSAKAARGEQHSFVDQ